MNKHTFVSVLIVVLAVSVFGCATSSYRGPSDEELITGLLGEWKSALIAQDIDATLESYSEDYQSERSSGKDGIRQMFSQAFSRGYMTNAEINVEDASITVDGDTAVVTPIVMSSERGSMSFELTLKKEASGWLIIGSRFLQT